MLDNPITGSQILLLNSDDCTRNVMQRVLEHKGADVLPSATAFDALSLIVKQDFDVRIINLHDLGINGCSFLMAAIQHFQSNALIVAVSDSLNLQQAIWAICLQAEVIVRSSDVEEVAAIVYARIEARNLLQSWTPQMGCKPTAEAASPLGTPDGIVSAVAIFQRLLD